MRRNECTNRTLCSISRVLHRAQYGRKPKRNIYNEKKKHYVALWLMCLATKYFRAGGARRRECLPNIITCTTPCDIGCQFRINGQQRMPCDDDDLRYENSNFNNYVSGFNDPAGARWTDNRNYWFGCVCARNVLAVYQLVRFPIAPLCQWI